MGTFTRVFSQGKGVDISLWYGDRVVGEVKELTYTIVTTGHQRKISGSAKFMALLMEMSSLALACTVAATDEAGHVQKMTVVGVKFKQPVDIDGTCEFDAVGVTPWHGE